VTPQQSAEIVSILSAGTFFGALTAAPAGDFFGRRYGLIVSVAVFTLGVILQTAATAIPMFVAGRFFAGYGVGMISALIPLYQSETSPKWIRGTVVGAYQFAITIGLLLAAVIGNSTKDLNNTGSYRIPVAVQFAWAIIMVVGMLILPGNFLKWLMSQDQMLIFKFQKLQDSTSRRVALRLLLSRFPGYDISMSSTQL